VTHFLTRDVEYPWGKLTAGTVLEDIQPDPGDERNLASAYVPHKGERLMIFPETVGEVIAVRQGDRHVFSINGGLVVAWPVAWQQIPGTNAARERILRSAITKADAAQAAAVAQAEAKREEGHKHDGDQWVTP
jgi:hypothetical protein